MKKTIPCALSLVALLLLSSISRAQALPSGAQAQSNAIPQPSGPASPALFKTIQDLDTRLFDAYNHCDLPTLSSLVADDLEFYHDITGLSIGRQALVDAIKNNICGKVTRELVHGTLEVYPIANYGAVEIGVHRFHHPNDPTNIGEAKFMTLWQFKDNTWKITRVFSFDHHPLTK